MYPIPINDDQRLSVLRRVSLLRGRHDPAFERLCALAADRFSTPIAIVSMVDRAEQWFKAEVGLGIETTPRAVSFCANAILSDEVFVVPDARLDARFASNPLVTGWPGIVFYAGAPIVYGEGIHLGTVCVIDTRPRVFDREEAAALATLADTVSDEIWVALSQSGQAA